MQIRKMRPEDLSQVVSIEREGHPVGWSEKIFAEELEREWARLIVVEVAGTIAAYCNYWLVEDEVHLLNIVTASAQRRRGYAAVLMQELLQSAQSRGSKLVTLEVRVSNTAAIAMYERFGFLRIGIRPKYYSDNQEDALIMHLQPDS